MASVSMGKDVTKFTSQMYVPLIKIVKRNIFVAKYILTYVTILKSLDDANLELTVSACTWKVLKQSFKNK